MLNRTLHNIVSNELSELPGKEHSGWRMPTEEYNTLESLSTHGMSIIRKIKSLGIENEIDVFPEFIKKFSDYNIAAAKKISSTGYVRGEMRMYGGGNVVTLHVRLIRAYLSAGMHKVQPEYSDKLAAAIQGSNAELYPAIRKAYYEIREEAEDKGIFDWWRIFGVRVDALKYYHMDQDYPDGLYDKDSEFIPALTEEIARRNRSSKDFNPQDFVYGFMYWSIQTFNSMGEYSEDPDLDNYIEHIDDIWPKRAPERDDESFRAGYAFRDEIERAKYPNLSRPVPYEQEEVDQQIAIDYQDRGTARDLSDEDIDKIDEKVWEARRDLRDAKRTHQDRESYVRWKDTPQGRATHVFNDEDPNRPLPSVDPWTEEDEEDLEILEDLSRGEYKVDPDGELVYHRDRLASLTTDNLSRTKRASILKALLHKASGVQ